MAIDFPGAFNVNRRDIHRTPLVVRMATTIWQLRQSSLEIIDIPLCATPQVIRFRRITLPPTPLPLLMGVPVHPVYARFAYQSPSPRRQLVNGAVVMRQTSRHITVRTRRQWTRLDPLVCWRIKPDVFSTYPFMMPISEKGNCIPSSIRSSFPTRRRAHFSTDTVRHNAS